MQTVRNRTDQGRMGDESSFSCYTTTARNPRLAGILADSPSDQPCPNEVLIHSPLTSFP